MIIPLILLLTPSGNGWWAFMPLLLLTNSYASCNLYGISLFAVEWEGERRLSVRWGVTELCQKARVLRVLLKHLQHSLSWNTGALHGTRSVVNMLHVFHSSFWGTLCTWAWYCQTGPPFWKVSAGCYGLVCLFSGVICIELIFPNLMTFLLAVLVNIYIISSAAVLGLHASHVMGIHKEYFSWEEKVCEWCRILM